MRGLLFAVGVLSGAIGTALLFELLALRDDCAPAPLSARLGRRGAQRADRQAPGTANAAVAPLLEILDAERPAGGDSAIKPRPPFPGGVA